MEPHHRQRFKRLTDRLLSIVVSGDDCGMNGLDALWADDAPEAVPIIVSDIRTAAKCQLSFPLVQEAGAGYQPPIRRVLLADDSSPTNAGTVGIWL